MSSRNRIQQKRQISKLVEKQRKKKEQSQTWDLEQEVCFGGEPSELELWEQANIEIDYELEQRLEASLIERGRELLEERKQKNQTKLNI